MVVSPTPDTTNMQLGYISQSNTDACFVKGEVHIFFFKVSHETCVCVCVLQVLMVAASSLSILAIKSSLLGTFLVQVIRDRISSVIKNNALWSLAEDNAVYFQKNESYLCLFVLWQQTVFRCWAAARNDTEGEKKDTKFGRFYD